MSIHFLEVNAMMARAQDYLTEAQRIYVRHVVNRKAISDDDAERLDLLVTEVDAISEKLQEVDMCTATGWPDWALNEIAIKDESLKFESKVLEVLEQRYIEIF